MANHASAIKRAKQSEARRMRNKAYRTQVRHAVKAVRLAVTAKDQEKAGIALKQAISLMDKAASKGVIHRNNAARNISRLSSQVHALSV